MKKILAILVCLSPAFGFGQSAPGNGPAYIPGLPTTITSPTNGQCLVYQTSTKTWINSSGCGGSSTPAFNTVAAGTNTNALLVGSGGTFGPTGTGSVTANAVSNGTDITLAAILATGSVTARTPGARAAEVFNVLDWCSSVTCTGVTLQDAAVGAAVTAINAAGGGQLYFAPGLSWAINTQHVFTTYAASVVGGGINTTTILTNGGGGFEWTTATSQSNGGHCTIRDFRMFQNDNATSGSQILLNNVDFCTLNNLQLGGGFISLDIASSVAITITNFIIEGHNNTSGSMGMRIHRTNSGASNASEIEMTNFDIRADASGTLTYGMRVSDSDGLYVGNGHIGFGASAGILIQAENTTDQLDGILFANTNVDTTSVGPEVDIETQAGQTGADGGNGFVGGSIANATAAGVLMNDSNAQNWTFTGVQFNSNGTHGIDIEAGTGIVIVGGSFVCNNRSAASANHVNMGGSASYVVVSNNLFQQGVGSRCTNAVTDNILVGGTTANAQIGQNLYSGGGANVSITSGGAGNTQIGTFATANAATPPAIGTTTPNTGAFSSLQIAGNLSTAAPLTGGIGLLTSSVVYTDTSGTGGTIANSYMYALPAVQLRTTTTTTYSNVYGLYVPVPSCGSGGGGTPTCTTLGGILTNGSITAQSGAIITGGNTIINNGGSVTTTINAGSNSGTLTLGNSTGPNTTNLSSPTINMANIASSSAAQTGTVCRGTGGLLTYDTTTTCLLSDGRHKMNVEPLGAAIPEVMKMRPVSYDLKPEVNPTGLGRQVGLIAQDVMAIDPRLAAVYQSGPDIGTPSGVRYEQMVALLVKGMQEQQHEIDALKRQLKHRR